MIDIVKEIKFKTARSGGKGGQNVNKVETMVEGYFDIESSNLFTEEQKQLIKKNLAHKITGEGLLQVKSQTERTQLGNKEKVIYKINQLLTHSLQTPKKRKQTKPTKAAKEKRISIKKKNGEIKELRKKVRL